MLLKEVRAAMAAKQAEIRAKMAELDTAPAERHAEIETAHDMLVAEYDALAKREQRLVASETRDATLAGHAAAAAAAAAAAVGAEGAAVDGVLSASDGVALIEEGRAHGVEAEARTAVLVAGATSTTVREAILKACAERQKEATGRIQAGGAGQLDERETKREAVVEYLMHRSKPAEHKLTEKSKDLRGSSLLDLAAETLAWNGVSTRGMTKTEIAERALMTTSDFPLTLAAVSNKTLRRAYEIAPRTFMPLGRQISLTDFKSAHRIKLGEAPQLEEVKEDGEFKRGSMTESDETIALATYGKVVGITRKVIINDDLGAFTNLPGAFGMSAATLESNIVWGLILSNPALKTDNLAVFQAAKHKNYIATGSGAAPSVASVGAARTAMRKQTGLDGVTILDVMPKYIVIPTELEVPVAQLLYPIQANATAAAVPQSITSLIPISEPRLSGGTPKVAGIAAQGGSATGWYLFADTANVDTFEYAYLDGQEGPYTETRQGFDVDGVEVKCRHDFGAAMIDYRGMYLNAGS